MSPLQFSSDPNQSRLIPPPTFNDEKESGSPMLAQPEGCFFTSLFWLWLSKFFDKTQRHTMFCSCENNLPISEVFAVFAW